MKLSFLAKTAFSPGWEARMDSSCWGWIHVGIQAKCDWASRCHRASPGAFSTSMVPPRRRGPSESLGHGSITRICSRVEVMAARKQIPCRTEDIIPRASLRTIGSQRTLRSPAVHLRSA
jgi:hypothetical protein